ncbi:MAG: hypothetical protein ABI574_02840 [Burkholderiales bacterium]
MKSLDLLNGAPKLLACAWNELDNARGYWADGGSGENGIRSNANMVFSVAVWLRYARPEARKDWETVHSRALSLVRYLCYGHVTGAGTCADGRRWGLNWQSSWWAAKLGLAVWCLEDRCPDDLHVAARKVLIAEADHHLSRVAPTGLFLDTKAEETAWDVEALAVACLIAPDAPQRDAWLAKLIEFSFNVFSAPQDRLDTRMVDGAQVCQQVYTCNTHGDHSLDNHGSFHFCYVASPLVSKAWSWFALRAAGLPVPQALQHHVADLWHLARQTFLTNRFAYVGGQDWARYAYGEYFIVPALSYLERVVDDPAIHTIQQARLRFMAKEAQDDPQGGFYGRRFTHGRLSGQFAKYESDALACMALAVVYDTDAHAGDPAIRTPLPQLAEEDAVHVSPEGQFCFWRTPRFFFGFSWTHLDHPGPSLVFGPTDRDDMIDWREGNGLGRVDSLAGQASMWGVRSMRRLGRTIQIKGQMFDLSRRGRRETETTLELLLDADTATCSFTYQVRALRRLWWVRVIPLGLHVPNDMFNGYMRTVEHEGRRHMIASSRPDATGAMWAPPSSWKRRWRGVLRRLGVRVGERSYVFPGPSICIDDTLEVSWLNGVGLAWRQFDRPNSPSDALWVDRLDLASRRLMLSVAPGDLLLDIKVTLAVRGSIKSG